MSNVGKGLSKTQKFLQEIKKAGNITAEDLNVTINAQPPRKRVDHGEKLRRIAADNPGLTDNEVVELVAQAVRDRENDPQDPLSIRLHEIESTKILSAADYAIVVT